MVFHVLLAMKSVAAFVSLLPSRKRRIPTWTGLIRTNLCRCLIGTSRGITRTDGLRQTITLVMLCQPYPIHPFLRNFTGVDIFTQIIAQIVSILCSSFNALYVSPSSLPSPQTSLSPSPSCQFSSSLPTLNGRFRPRSPLFFHQVSDSDAT